MTIRVHHSAIILSAFAFVTCTTAANQKYFRSVDALASKIEALPRNRAYRASVEQRLKQVNPESGSEISRRLAALNIVPLRIPGLYYRSHPQSGAALSIMEVWLDREIALVETDEVGTIYANAITVANAIRDATREGERVALFSASKGSADVLWALRSEPEIANRVALWFDLVGVLEGTPLIDPGSRGRRESASWLPAETADSMSAARRRRTYDGSFPTEVRAVHLAAFPRVNQVSPPARASFRELRRLGPTDGYVMLTSYLRAPGRVLILRGTDHYLKTPKLAPHSAAMLLVLLDELEAER